MPLLYGDGTFALLIICIRARWPLAQHRFQLTLWICSQRLGKSYARQSQSPFILPVSPWKNSEFLFWNFHIQQPELNFMLATLPVFNGIKSYNIHQGLKSLLLCKRFPLAFPAVCLCIPQYVHTFPLYVLLMFLPYVLVWRWVWWNSSRKSFCEFPPWHGSCPLVPTTQVEWWRISK